MRRLRILFAVFALVLLAPVGLLVERSLQSIELEKKVRQQTIAERIFDEMERALSELLAKEESASTIGYPPAATNQQQAFVVGRFEIDLERPSGDIAERVDDSRRDRSGFEEDDTDVAELEEVARSLLGAVSETKNKKEADAAQAPGTTVRLEEGSAGAGPAAPVPSEKRGRRLSDYAALRSLNKAASERSSNRERESRDSYGGAPEGRTQSRQRPTDRAEILDLRRESFATARMTGSAVSEDRLMLYRTVARDGVLYRQGVLLNIENLGRWLQQKSIGTSWLTEYARVRLFTSEAPVPSVGGGDSTLYSHRFAVPFADLTAHLTLRPFTAMRSTAYVYALSILVVVATAAGLTLLFRIVALTVRFAERRNNFVAAVSHELKTPLTAIRMYGEMLRDGVVPDEGKRQEYYGRITNESERLSRLINNVLEYSQIEKGTRPVTLSVGSLAPVMTEVAEMMRPHAAEHGYEIALEIEPDLPNVRFEGDALKQVLWNLIDNAVKYGGSSTRKRIDLRVARERDEVVVSVRDHGRGVGRRELDEIFEPFYRGGSELTRSAKGTGIGLALVRGLVEKMGAGIAARNVAGGGLTVEIRFQALG